MENHSVMPRTLAGQEQKKLKKVCTHIKEGTFVWTDSQRAYDGVLSERNCPHKELKSGLSYDQVNHLNTGNSLHSKINEVIRQYRNVSSIYINRYAALFSLQQRFAGFDLHRQVCNESKREYINLVRSESAGEKTSLHNHLCSSQNSLIC